MRNRTYLFAILAVSLAVHCACGGDREFRTPEQTAAAAIERGDNKALEAALANGLNPNAKPDGTPLVVDCFGPHGNNSAAELLLNAGADPNATDGSGDTALMEAAMWVNTPGIRLLLNHGADPRLANHDGETVLHRVAFAGPDATLEAVQVLIAAGADVNATTKSGHRCLDHFLGDDKTSVAVAAYLKSVGATIGGPSN